MAGTYLGRWAKRHWAGEADEVLLVEIQRAGALPKARMRGILTGITESLRMTQPCRTVSIASAASFTSVPLATTTSCSGKAAASRSPSKRAASASRAPKCRSTKLSTGESRSTTATPAWNTQPSQGGDTFMLPLG